MKYTEQNQYVNFGTMFLGDNFIHTAELVPTSITLNSSLLWPGLAFVVFCSSKM